MSVTIKEFLADLNWMKACMGKVHFSCRNGLFVTNRMPTIDEWNGVVFVAIENKMMLELMTRLKKYGIVAKEAAVEGRCAIKVVCNCDNDFIHIIKEVLEGRARDYKARNMDILHSEIDELAKQLPYVQSSMFSRGVKNLRHSVDVLNNVVVSQKKELGR